MATISRSTFNVTEWLRSFGLEPSCAILAQFDLTGGDGFDCPEASGESSNSFASGRVRLWNTDDWNNRAEGESPASWIYAVHRGGDSQTRLTGCVREACKFVVHGVAGTKQPPLLAGDSSRHCDIRSGRAFPFTG